MNGSRSSTMVVAGDAPALVRDAHAANVAALDAMLATYRGLIACAQNI